MDQARFAALAAAAPPQALHSAQSDAAELGLLTPSQQEPESISADNLYGNEDDEANLRQMDNEDLGLVPKSQEPSPAPSRRPPSSCPPIRHPSPVVTRRALPRSQPPSPVVTRRRLPSRSVCDQFKLNASV